MFFLDVVDPIHFVPDIALPLLGIAAVVIIAMLIFKRKK